VGEKYEITFLIKEGNSPNKLEEILSSNNAKIGEKTNYGLKRLAYKIKGLQAADLYTYYFEAENQSIAEITKELQLVSVVIRFLIVTEVPKSAKIESFRQKPKREESKPMAGKVEIKPTPKPEPEQKLAPAEKQPEKKTEEIKKTTEKAPAPTQKEPIKPVKTETKPVKAEREEGKVKKDELDEKLKALVED